jgi:hypothetical protein
MQEILFQKLYHKIRNQRLSLHYQKPKYEQFYQMIRKRYLLCT